VLDIGISTGLFYHRRINFYLPKIKSAGFKAIELWVGASKWGKETHFDYNKAEEVEEIKRDLRVLSLNVVSLNAPFSELLDISSMDEMQRSIAVAEIKKTISLCEFFNAEYIVIHPSVKTFPLTDIDTVKKKIQAIRKSLNEILENAMLHNVKVACENPSPHLLGGWAKDLLTLIDRFPKEYLGVCFDVGHANLIGNPVDFLKEIADRLFTLHVSDNNSTYSAHLPPGDGNIDWMEFVKALKEINFKNCFMLEVLGGARFDDIDEVLKKSYKRADEILKKADL